MNWKGYERKRSWSSLRRHPGICIEGMKKATKIGGWDSRYSKLTEY